MQEDSSFECRTLRRFESAALVLLQLAVLDQLGEDVFELPPGRWRGIELHQELMQVSASPIRLLYGPQDVFLADLCLWSFSTATHSRSVY